MKPIALARLLAVAVPVMLVLIVLHCGDLLGLVSVRGTTFNVLTMIVVAVSAALYTHAMISFDREPLGLNE